MTQTRALALALAFALAVCPLARAADDLTTDLGWIGSLPGFAVKDRAPNETSYLVSGDAKAAFEGLAKALTERGWQIAPGKSNTVSLISAQRMTATKGGVEAFFHMKQAAIITKLIVTTRTVTAEQAPAPKTTAAAPAPRPAAGGKGLDLYDNGLRGTYLCNGGAVTVNGNACDITLEGACASLAVNGNANRIHVAASIASISALGTQNTVTWSRASNPQAPRVTNLGGGNVVQGE